MKRIILFSTILLGMGSLLIAQTGIEQECVNCKENEISRTSSAVGVLNVATGETSFASGYLNTSTGDYSTTLGFNNSAQGNYSIAGGEECIATGLRAFAFGQYARADGSRSLALGKYVRAAAGNSVAIGRYVKSNISDAMILGCGLDTDRYITNSISGSFMIGYNSDVHTFFVGSAYGENTTGRVGIGNVTEPDAKLHIRGDDLFWNTDDASLFIESAGNRYSFIYLGDKDHYIKTKPGYNLEFYVEDQDFYFNGGNVGIGIDDPDEKLEVSGNILAEKFYGDGSELEGVNDNLGNHVATQNIQLAGNFLSGDGSDEGIFISNYGRVGINTDEPAAKLHIASAEDSKLRLEYRDAAPVESAISKFWDIHNAAGKLKFQYGSGSGEPTSLNLLVIDEDGNVGIGIQPDPNHKLDVDGNINFTGILKQNGEIFETTKWTENADGNIFFNDGNVGIGTSTPPGRLSLQSQAGENVGMSYNNGGSAIYWTGVNATTNAFILGGTGGQLPETGAINILGGNVGIGMLPGGSKALDVNGDINLTGDLYKQGSMMDFTQWEENGNDLHYDSGKVGIGTGINDIEANLHIYDPEGMTSTEELRSHLKIDSEVGIYGGTTTIGRLYNSGPLIEQRATTNSATRLWFRQSTNNQLGLSISTYSNNSGNVKEVDIFAENGPFYLRSMEGLHVKVGGNNPIKFYTKGVEGKETGILQMEINADGQVGIGTTNHLDQDTKLTVAGRIHAQEVKVTASAGDGADFVFEEDYDLPQIEQVAEFVKENKHLPDIPSAKQMQEEGLDIGEMQIKLLQKIEELTLYVIDLKKENEEMRNNNAEMKAEIEKLKRR